ncbi:MAG: transposase, partial [Bradymonadaceae bacterium]
MEGIEIQDDEMVFEEALRQALEKEGHEVIYRSVDRVAAALEEVRSTKRRRKRPGSGSVSASLTEQLLEKSRLRERRRERRDLLQNGVFVHVTSRIHLQRKLLREDEVKAILARKCRHYARVCKIELHHYCIMDNHLHLVLRICSESSALDRMMADIKREFTKEYKHWFNHVHRKTIKYRSEKLGRGTLWDGPYTCEIIEDMPQLAAASFYVEANRLKVIARSAIVELTRAPRLLEMEQGRLDEE